MAKATTKALNGSVSVLEQIDRNIANIVKKGKALRMDCHETLVMVIDHYIEHGDYTRLPNLTNAVKTALGSSMSAGMNVWIARFVPSLKWNNDEQAFKHDKSVKKEILSVPEDKPVFSKTDKGPDGKPRAYFGDARKIPFFELEPETRQQPFNFNVAFLQLLKRAEQALEKNVKEGGKNIVDKETIDRMKNVAVELHILKGEDVPTIAGPTATNTAEQPNSDNGEKIADAA